MTHLKAVETIYAVNASNIPAMLRQAADNIETETDDNDRTKAIIAVQVTHDGTVAIYGWGATERFGAIGVLQAGIVKLCDGVTELEV